MTYKKRHKMSEELKKRLSEIRLKGIAEGRIKIWNKGITGNKLSEEHKNKISKNNARYWLGKHTTHTEEQKNKISKSLMGKKHSEERNNKQRYNWKIIMNRPEHIERMKKFRSTQIFPKKDTSIELKIQNFLKELGITFFTHQYIKEIEHSYQCDILIPSMNLVIETDGDYWHKYPIGRDIDKIRTSELIEKGFKVLRLWEHEIKVMDLNKFKERLI